MTKFLLLALGLVLSCLDLVHADYPAGIDTTAQQVFRQNGVESKILRPYAQLRKNSPRKDGRFFFSFAGDPGIKILLDRDYWVLAIWSAKKDNDVLGYVLNPQDGQSALNISIGNDIHDKSDADLGQQPGISKITFADGIIGGQKITWRRWSDREHLYSECTFIMPSPDRNGAPGFKVSVDVTANTEARRRALERALASLHLLPAKRADGETSPVVRPPPSELNQS